MTRIRWVLLQLVTVACFVGVAVPAAAQSGAGDKPLATRALDVDGVVAEVVESDRQDGVLTVRVRFRNTSDAPAKLRLVDAQGYVHTYIVSGDTKYALLRDTSGKDVATPRDGGGWLEPTVRPKATWAWWGKFPAPPPDRKSYSLYLKVGPPIDNIPIVDKR
jgi:hypothetical protein